MDVSKASIVHKKIAQNLLRFRKAKGMTQEQVAYEADLNRAYIGYIERGERKPSVETLEKIARVLGIKLMKLFDFE